MGPQDITFLSLGLCLLLLLIPLGLSRYFKLGLVRPVLFSAARMGVQLFLMGIYLTWLFILDNTAVNIGWMAVMVIAAAFTVIKNSGLNKKLLLAPVCLSLFISVAFMILYFNTVVLRLPSIFAAKYFLVIGGMLMGNSLRGNIVGLTNFYRELQQNQQQYIYSLTAGATVFEAALPYIRHALSSALRPTIATMATMGLVFLPGMMTGQILGGSPPLTAIKYQIAIMITIFTLAALTVTLTILLSLRRSFNEFGILRRDVFDN